MTETPWPQGWLHRVASARLAIPLLLVTAGTAALGARSGHWFEAVLGAVGFSLAAVTLQWAPSTWRNRGRSVALGIFSIHLGVLLLIAAILAAPVSGYRYSGRLVEGEATVLPGVPFVIKLTRLDDAVDAQGVRSQDCELEFYRAGTLLSRARAGPGNPARVEGVTVLPLDSEQGWAFDMLVRDPANRETVVPVRPWLPPLIKLGFTRTVVAHFLAGAGPQVSVDIKALEAGKGRRSLGVVTPDHPLVTEGYTLSLDRLRRYTGVSVYHRPAEWLYVAAGVLLIGGLFRVLSLRARKALRQSQGEHGNA